MRLLLAEDEAALSKALTAILERNNYSVDSVCDGQAALEYLESDNYDGVILDIMMPKIDGITVLRKLRQKGSLVPVLLLTAKSEVDDKVLGLELGADDYMVSPVDVEELALRVQALLRRSNSIHARQIHTGTTVLDYDSLTLSTRDVSWSLPQKEFLLLYKLASYPGKIFTRQQLIDEIWGLDSESDIRTVDVHINRLRERLKYNPDLDILTVRGLGYKAVNRVM